MTETSSLSTLDFIIRFLMFPAAIIAIIWFLWALPAWLRRGSHRPGEPWVGDPLWIGAPTQAVGQTLALPAGSTAGTSDDGRGGASARW